jgi:hypothetical protein
MVMSLWLSDLPYSGNAYYFETYGLALSHQQN